MSLTRSHGYLEGVGRLRLHYRSWEPKGARAAVLIVHGLAEHSGRYEHTAESLGANGFSCFALDLRGHGYSDGRRGHASSFDLYLQDLDRFRRQVQGLIRPGMPTFLLGHSLGGLIALRYLEEYDTPLGGGVLVSPWVATGYPIPRWKTTLAVVLSRILPSLPIGANIPAQTLSHDPAIVRDYEGDPLVHDRVTPRLFTEISEAMGLVSQRADRLHVPLLFLIAGDDALVDAERARGFASSLARRLPDVTIRVYPGQYHELLNELDRTLVLGDIRDWLIDREHVRVG